jgi:hypothetical protein
VRRHLERHLTLDVRCRNDRQELTVRSRLLGPFGWLLDKGVD